jgi:hypothetical protein
MILSCSQDNPTGPSSEKFRYPLQIGNEWHYDRQVSLTYDVKSGVRLPEITTSSVRVVAAGETVLFDSLTTIKLEENGSNATGGWANSSFYQNKADGLYLISGAVEPLALPKTTKRNDKFGIVAPGIYSFSKENTIFFSENARRVLQYPLKPGTEWTYAEQNKPRRMNKKVIGTADITTRAGTFKTVKIQWIVDFDGDGQFDNSVEFFDYIADEGLVKRSFLIKNLPVLDDDGGNIGSYDYLDESLLSSVTLK